MDCFRLRISGSLTVFSPTQGIGTNIYLMNSKRFSSGNHRSIAAPSEQDYQQTGVGIASEDEYASLASSRKNASHASWHDQPLLKFQNDTNTMQVVYHLAVNSIGAHSEGVDWHSITVFT